MENSKYTIYLPPYEFELRNDRLYGVWRGMLTRCYNPNTKCYHRYGGRGIGVCNEWRLSFSSFKAWALEAGYDYAKPRQEQTIDRIDNDGNYEPSNCRWVSLAENLRNRERSGRKPKPKQKKKPEKKKRDLITWEINGVAKPAAEWCREYDVNYTTAKERMKRGMTPYEALTAKPDHSSYTRYYWRKSKKSSPSTVQVNELP